MKQKILLPTLLCFLATPIWAQTTRAEFIVTEVPKVNFEKKGRLNYVVGSVLIDAPRDEVWDILVDYENAPEIFKNLSLCRVVGTEGDIKLVRQLVKPGGPVKFDYIVNLREYKPRLIEWKRRSGSLEEVTGTWELEPAEDGDGTKVTYKIHLDGGILLPAWLLSTQVKGYLPTMLHSLKEKVESRHKDKK